MILARSPIGRGANPLSLERAKIAPRRERDEPPASFSPLLGLLTHPATASPTATHCGGRVAAGAGVERGLSTRFSNRHLVSVRRQPRGSFGINAPDCKQVLPTTSRLRLLGWPTTLRLLTNLICNRPLSSSDSSMKPLFCVRKVRCPRPQGRSPENAAFTLRDRSPCVLPPQSPRFATADLFSAAAALFSAAALTFSAAADPTLSDRSTFHFAPAATSIHPICHLFSANPLSIVWLLRVLLCGHRTAAFGHTADLVWSFQQSC